MKVLAGRYGPYVTDGTTNASIPKTMSPDELTFEQAQALLAARRDAAPTPRRAGGRRTTGGSRRTASARKTAGVA